MDGGVAGLAAKALVVGAVTWRPRWLALPLAVVLAVTLLGQQPALAAPSDWKPPTPKDVAGVRVVDTKPGVSDAWSAESRAVRGPRTVSWPAAGTATADLSTIDTRGAAGGSARVRAGTLPVRLGRAGPVEDDRAVLGRMPASPGKVQVRVFDREATARAAVQGLLLGVGRADGEAGAALVAVEVDYSGFAHAFGGDWASRLRLARLPACAVTSPQAAECQTATPLVSRNDATSSTVSATVPVVGDQSTLVAVMSAPSGDNGDYTATSLSPAATWQVSTQTGDFAWSYPLRMPPALGGPAPSVALAYSSGSVDGRTGTSNNQGSWIGDGWDSWPGFIERKYASCSDDNPLHKTGDQCWFSDNATLSLNGRAGELIQSGGTWRLKNDDGTRIERLSDAGRGNGDNDNEYWKVTTTDGVQYFFGYHKLPNWASVNAVTNSTWTVPVYGNNSGEPCYNAAFRQRLVPAGVAVEPGLRRGFARQLDGLLLR